MSDRALGAFLVAVLAFLYLPIAVLVGLSFNESGLPTSWGGFSTKWYSSAFGDEEITSAFGRTLVVGVVSTAIAVVIGTLLAIGLERVARSTLLDGLAFTPMIIPDIVLAIALLSFYNVVFVDAGLQLGLWSVILAHATFNIAFVAAIVRTRLRHFDLSTLEASRDLGASEWQTFRLVLLPQILPGVIAGALVAFTLSVDEFVIAFFTAGASATFPIQVYSMIRFGVTPEINAIATVVVLVSFFCMLVALRVRREELA